MRRHHDWRMGTLARPSFAVKRHLFADSIFPVLPPFEFVPPAEDLMEIEF